MALFRRRGPEKMKHLRGMIRVCGYLCLVSLIFGAFAVRKARAEYRDQTLILGRQMVELARASNHGVTKLLFNGQNMYLGSSSTDDSPSAVLARYEGHCRANPGQPSAGWEEIEKKAGKKDAPDIVKSGVVRSGDEAEGTVVCFVRGSNTKASTEEAFDSFLQTGSLGALGDLRYVYASKSEKSGKTLVLTAWTDSKFNLYELLGDPDKDSAGNDFPEVPRVPNAIRAISASAEGTPYGVNVYKTKDAPAKSLAFFDDEMLKRNWISYDPELTEEKDGTQGRAYMKDGVILSVATSVEPEGNFVALGLSGVAADDNASKSAKNVTRN